MVSYTEAEEKSSTYFSVRYYLKRKQMVTMIRDYLEHANFEDTGFSYTLSLISGKHKMVILYCLMEFAPVRFNQLQRYLKKVSDKTLSQNLKELERDGLVYSQRTAGRFVTEDNTMINQAKRSLAERHVKTFLEAMLRLGFQKDEIIALITQELGEEEANHASA